MLFFVIPSPDKKYPPLAPTSCRHPDLTAEALAEAGEEGSLFYNHHTQKTMPVTQYKRFLSAFEMNCIVILSAAKDLTFVGWQKERI